MLWFHFSLADDHRSSYRDLLLSLLLQLLYGENLVMETDFVQRVSTALEEPHGLSVPNLYRLLSAMLIRLADRMVMCVIDALDECDEESRRQLMGDFKRIAAKGLTSCRVIVTCRPHADITAHLGPPTEVNNVDLDEKMKRTRDLIMARELKDEKFAIVRDFLSVENATPLKVWLAASLGTTDTSELADYSSIYTKLLAQIEAPPERVREVLLCVAFAKRPLTVCELATAMGVDGAGGYRQTSSTIRVASPKQLQEDLELALGSLVCIKDNIVRLVHVTLRELIRGQPETLFQTATAQADQQPTWRSLVLRKCSLILSIPEIREMDALAVRKHSFPFDNLSDGALTITQQPHSFASYAGTFWLRHMTEDDDTASEEYTVVQPYFSAFWEDTAARSWWLDPFAPSETQRSAPEQGPDGLDKRLRLAASLGARPIVKSLLQHSIDREPKVNLRPTLEAAVLRGDSEMTSQILKAANDINHELRLFSVENACRHGHAELVKSLLSRWAEGDEVPQPPEGDALGSYLGIAAEHGHWPVMVELLKGFPGPKLPLGQDKLASLVKVAATQGRDGVVFEVLALAADKTGRDAAPAQTAVQVEDEDEDEMEPRIESRTSWLNDALFAAAAFGSAATVCLLAQAGADIEYRKGWLFFTAIHVAASGQPGPQLAFRIVVLFSS